MKIAVASTGIPYSRYFFSWIREADAESCGHQEFTEWLKSEGLQDDEIQEMGEIFLWGGKFELEQRVKPYAKKYFDRMRARE